jgi:hypothetical protein
MRLDDSSSSIEGTSAGVPPWLTESTWILATLDTTLARLLVAAAAALARVTSRPPSNSEILMHVTVVAMGVRTGFAGVLSGLPPARVQGALRALRHHGHLERVGAGLRVTPSGEALLAGHVDGPEFLSRMLAED